MLLSLDAGVSALNQFQQNLNVIGNNIANVNTVGFKNATVGFADSFSQTLGASAAGSMQVGTGVSTNAITNQFTQGAISSTGLATDLAVNGNGFFMVNDATSGQQYVTRDGAFSTDTSGYLITSNGMRVQGYTDASLSTKGDIKIDNTGAPLNADGSVNTSAVAGFTFDNTGKLKVLLADGTQFTRGQVLLQNFSNPSQLLKAGNNLYGGLAAAGPLTTPLAPGSNGLGNLVAGSLEMSNVNLAVELTSLITTQRAYEASGKVITTSDEILQTLVNLKR